MKLNIMYMLHEVRILFNFFFVVDLFVKIIVHSKLGNTFSDFQNSV